MAVSKGSDPLTGSPDAASRGAGTSGRSKRLEPTPAALLNLPDPLAAQSFDWATVAQGAGGSAVSFPLQDPVQSSGGVSGHPWKVRWHTDKDGRNGQYEVLSPTGNFSGIGVCEVMNKKATEKSGHEIGTDMGWYLVGVGGELNDGDYKVVAHFKAAAKFGDKAYRRPAVFVGIMLAEDEPTDDVDTYAGDYASFTVATIHVETDDEGNVTRRIRQIVTTPYTVDMGTGSVGQPCLLGGDFMVTGSTLSVSNFGFAEENVVAAGISGSVDLDVPKNEACSVWVHAVASGGSMKLELKKLAAGTNPGTLYNDTEMYIHIYEISDYGTIVNDTRANLHNVPYYR